MVNWRDTFHAIINQIELVRSSVYEMAHTSAIATNFRLQKILTLEVFLQAQQNFLNGLCI